MNIKHKINNWYQGQFTSDTKRNEYGGIEIFDILTHHWTARYLHIIVNFYLNHWKWLLPFILLLIGTIIAIINIQKPTP